MTIEQTETIRLERVGSRFTITLNNPSVHNCLSSQDINMLIAVIKEVNTDTSIRVVVITGTGKSFCSGFDLSELTGLAEAAQLPNFDELTDELEGLRCPSICALNGGVYGGGIDLALACDFRLVTEQSKLLMPATKVGLHYYPNGIRRYVSRLGMAAAKRILLLSEPLSAEEMLSCGFADKLLLAGQMDAAVDKLAERLQANAPLCVEGIKHAINLYANANVDDQLVQNSFTVALESDDFKAGLQAVKAKKSANFLRQ